MKTWLNHAIREGLAIKGERKSCQGYYATCHNVSLAIWSSLMWSASYSLCTTHTFVYFYHRHVSSHFLHSSHNPQEGGKNKLQNFSSSSSLQVYVFISFLRAYFHTHCVFTYRLNKKYIRLSLTHWIKISICFSSLRERTLAFDCWIRKMKLDAYCIIN